MYEEEKKERFIKGSSVILLIWTIAFAISFVFNSIRIVWKETENENTARFLGERNNAKEICLKMGGTPKTNDLGDVYECAK